MGISSHMFFVKLPGAGCQPHKPKCRGVWSKSWIRNTLFLVDEIISRFQAPRWKLNEACSVCSPCAKKRHIYCLYLYTFIKWPWVVLWQTIDFTCLSPNQFCKIEMSPISEGCVSCLRGATTKNNTQRSLNNRNDFLIALELEVQDQGTGR